jgi:hypothetical protein
MAMVNGVVYEAQGVPGHTTIRKLYEMAILQQYARHHYTFDLCMYQDPSDATDQYGSNSAQWSLF